MHPGELVCRSVMVNLEEVVVVDLLPAEVSWFRLSATMHLLAGSYTTSQEMRSPATPRH
jgi:hypothetical protein